jgi:hypothetical protein
MSPSHRQSTEASSTASRRVVLGLAAAAAVSGAAAVGAAQIRKHSSPSGTLKTQPAHPGRSNPAPGTSKPPSPASTAKKYGGVVPGVPGKAMFGSYLSLQGMSDSEAMALRREQLGRDQRIVHVFYEWRDDLPSRVSAMPEQAYPLVSWRGTSYSEILSGGSDERIARAARRLKNFNRPVFLRWGWEMNGDWFAWGGPRNGNNPAGYVECWRRMHGIFKKEGATNVAWVWSPNWNSKPSTTASTWNKIEAYYPGDEYVDWVGVSGYNLNQEPPAHLYDGIYTRYAARKPMMITEMGAVEDGGNTKGDWIKRFATYAARRPNICAVVWFDTDTHKSYHEVWRVDSNAHSLAEYRAMVRSPRFSG